MNFDENNQWGDGLSEASLSSSADDEANNVTVSEDTANSVSVSEDEVNSATASEDAAGATGATPAKGRKTTTGRKSGTGAKNMKKTSKSTKSTKKTSGEKKGASAAVAAAAEVVAEVAETVVAVALDVAPEEIVASDNSTPEVASETNTEEVTSSIAAAVSDGEEAPVRKKRGRPSKAELLAAGTLPETTEAAPRRPGRPKGSKNAPKKPAPAKRGRKSKAEMEAIAIAAKEETAKLAESLIYKVPNAWEAKDLKRKAISDFAEEYKAFLDNAKTEREAVREAVKLAEQKGFRNLDALADDHPLVAGDCVYRVVRNKLIMLAVVGEKPMTDGVRILGAHVDSPRIDIKQNPLYENTDMAFLKTHYYGGIKKYQWTAIPLALHGVIVKTDGTTVDIVVGEKNDDPIFTITDLLPHLAKDQYDKKLADAFSGEAMNVLLGSEPYATEETKEKIKFNILRLLNESHGIKEEDFLSAELEIVPAFKARDLGLDRSMIGAYGHDDRVCAYPALMAVLETETPEYTSLCVLTDKEEIGSVGNTGAHSRAMENFLADLCAMSSTTPYTDRALRRCLDRSKMLSADVTAAVDPNYEGTHDKLNASYLGKGLAIMKYSGARGKSGASDAHAEYVAEVRKILNDAGVAWQTTELGAVDKGGGGTIAMMIANLGVDVIDCGVPVLSMHAPFEVVSKVDLYNTYKAYAAFVK